MPLFSVLERKPRAPPLLRQCGHGTVLLSTRGVKEAHAGSWERDPAATSVPRRGREAAALCPPPTRRLARSSPQPGSRVCSPGQNELLLWPRGHGLRASVSSVLPRKIYWEERETGKRKRKGSGWQRKETDEDKGDDDAGGGKKWTGQEMR